MLVNGQMAILMLQVDPFSRRRVGRSAVMPCARPPGSGFLLLLPRRFPLSRLLCLLLVCFLRFGLALLAFDVNVGIYLYTTDGAVRDLAFLSPMENGVRTLRQDNIGWSYRLEGPCRLMTDLHSIPLTNGPWTIQAQMYVRTILILATRWKGTDSWN